ncbi:MAG: clostripain-related cysteine peptidase [Anaerolineales bacterium]
MNTVSNRFQRLVAAVGIAVVLMAFLIVAALLRPDGTLAQGPEPEPVQIDPSPTAPPAPPPLGSPIQTPEPGQAAAAPAAGETVSSLEAVKFRPELRIELGQSTVAPKGGDKPSDLQNLPAKQIVGPQKAYNPPDFGPLLTTQNWNLMFSEDFEGVYPGTWQLFDNTDDGFERHWGDTSNWSQFGFWSAWPAARGANAVNPVDGYPDDMDSWMVQGPFDLSNMADVFVSYGLWYDTEPQFDWVYFCVSTEWPFFNCDYWSGYSDGWIDQAHWLTSYAGYSEVYFAWRFTSDDSIGGDSGYAGPYVDEVYVWGYDINATPTPTPTPDPLGQLVQNPSFETGDLTGWNSQTLTGAGMSKDASGLRPSLGPNIEQETGSSGPNAANDGIGPLDVGVTNATYVEGQYSAWLMSAGDVGTDFLYQTLSIPSGVDDVVLDLWSAVTTFETEVGKDWFCIALWSSDFPSSSSTILVDLGCLDATDTSGLWEEMVYTLTDNELSTVAGQSVVLVFELYNDGAAGSKTAGWVDYARVYAVGGGGAGSIDPNEPNDDYSSATTITCSNPISGTIGDALGGVDVDWFVLNNTPAGRLDIDIDADTKVPRSALDSVVYLYDNNRNVVAWNDDDGISFDSYIAYTNTVTNATYYISVESYSGYGSPDSFYDLTVQCAGAGAGEPAGGNEQLPDNAKDWTVMLYLNAEDPGFESLLTQYRQDIEKFIGGKSSFLNVVILYDGSGNGDTTRYLVQPNGNYTPGTNKWDMGELNVGHPDTLVNFVSWAMDQYPARNYYLAIDDHGDGAYGISVDRTSNNDLLTPPEVYSALKSATHQGDPNRKIDIFDYEACLMGLAENAYDVREWVDYVVFFEQISWGIDTYPTYFSDLAANDSALTVGQRIIDRYYQEALAANGGKGYPHTISLIDAGQMTAVRDAVTNFGNALQATGDKNAVNSARDKSQAFANDSDATDPRRADYIDLWDLADQASSLAPTQAAAVKSALAAAVVAERHASGSVDGFIWDHSGVHGLSIYYPPSTSSNAFNGYPTLYRMSQEGAWDEFLAWVLPTGTRRGMSASRSEDKLLGADTFVFRFVYLPAVLK